LKIEEPEGSTRVRRTASASTTDEDLKL